MLTFTSHLSRNAKLIRIRLVDEKTNVVKLVKDIQFDMYALGSFYVEKLRKSLLVLEVLSGNRYEYRLFDLKTMRITDEKSIIGKSLHCTLFKCSSSQSTAIIRVASLELILVDIFKKSGHYYLDMLSAHRHKLHPFSIRLPMDCSFWKMTTLLPVEVSYRKNTCLIQSEKNPRRSDWRIWTFSV